MSLNRDLAPLYQIIPCRTLGRGCSRLACRPYCTSLTKAACAGEQISHSCSQETSTRCGEPRPAPRVSLLPPQRRVPRSEAAGTLLPTGLCLQLVLAAGQGWSRGRSLLG